LRQIFQKFFQLTFQVNLKNYLKNLSQNLKISLHNLLDNESNKKFMTICYFGLYKKETRNKINLQGLEENGIRVIECHNREPGIKKYIELTKKYWPIRNDCDLIFVAYPGYVIMPLAWILAKITGKKIVFDAFMSAYDSMILDRQVYSKFSFQAVKYYLLDWLACILADIILLDADEHIKYFVKTFKISKSKFRRLLVGSDNNILYPREQKKETKNFLVHFHGTYIPLQGIPYIVKAAKILEKEDMEFNLIGRLDTYGEAIDLSKELGLNNINFIDYMPYAELGEYMVRADICLGMFGATGKAIRCSAFKVVEAIAMARPFITGDTPAMRELFNDKENCLFCKMKDEKDLAAKILELKNNPELRDKIAKNGYQTYLKYFTPKAIGAELKGIFKELIR